ncbi:MAG: cytochrome C biosynthesis protein, partial [Deltaproteobacteria bacterium]|nr:cytochrome C biosynthesis protein [Deltaproteobacteria bacterium]
TVNSWIAGGTAIAAVGCFIWGMISVVFSPCHLASIPLIVAYVGGQETLLKPKQAAWYSVAFTVGLFITIALIGIICALLGRMLGDVGNYWQILIGLVLVWVALGMLGVEKCSMSGNLLGSCTFGFIAPILAIITVQEKVVTGVLFILLFALGHCLPIVVAGSSTAAVKRVMESSRLQGAGNWFRKGAGIVIAGLGVYFIVNPFILT